VDLLKLIPQLFYDLISRVVPGGLAILALTAAANARVGEFLTSALAGLSPLQESTLFLGLALLMAAYLIGQLLSPLSDLFHRTLIRMFFRSHFEVLKSAVLPKSEYGDDVRHFLLRQLGIHDAANVDGVPTRRWANAIFIWHDWLRIKSPDAGVRAAKVRAEYRMHSQNAVVLVAGLICHLLLAASGHHELSARIVVFALAGAVLSTWAAARTYRNFQVMIINQYFSARGLT
jgi:hypothetical protein